MGCHGRQTDRGSLASTKGNKVCKVLKARAKRRAWARALKAGKDFPPEAHAADGHYEGYLS